VLTREALREITKSDIEFEDTAATPAPAEPEIPTAAEPQTPAADEEAEAE